MPFVMEDAGKGATALHVSMATRRHRQTTAREKQGSRWLGPRLMEPSLPDFVSGDAGRSDCSAQTGRLSLGPAREER